MTQTTTPPIHVLFVKGEPVAVSAKPFDLPQYGDPSALHQVQYPQSVSKLEKEHGERRFPMQRGPSIPWSLAEAIYAGYSAAYGTQQSLERLAERGGFSWPEVEVIYNNRDKRSRTAIDAAIATHTTPLPAKSAKPKDKCVDLEFIWGCLEMLTTDPDLSKQARELVMKARTELNKKDSAA